MQEPLNIILLTHERELARKTNTGALAAIHGGGLVQQVTWARTKPCKKLVALLQNDATALLSPFGSNESAGIQSFNTFVIIDSTWQESRKIVNRSPYLQSAATVRLSGVDPSEYALRRNQPSGGLCTAECVIELLKQKGHNAQAATLMAAFSEFNKR